MIKLQITWLRLLKMFWSQSLPGVDLHRAQHLALLAVTHNLQLIKLERKACSVIHAPCCIHCAYSSKTAGSCTWLEMSLLTAVCTGPADAALAMFLSVPSMMSPAQQRAQQHYLHWIRCCVKTVTKKLLKCQWSWSALLGLLRYILRRWFSLFWSIPEGNLFSQGSGWQALAEVGAELACWKWGPGEKGLRCAGVSKKIWNNGETLPLTYGESPFTLYRLQQGDKLCNTESPVLQAGRTKHPVVGEM